jgi:UDP-glucose 4-epimerase
MTLWETLIGCETKKGRFTIARMIKREMESGVYNFSHRRMSSIDMVDALTELYPGLETIFVAQHIPLHDLTMECDERLLEMLPGDTTMLEDLVKFRELLTL